MLRKGICSASIMHMRGCAVPMQQLLRSTAHYFGTNHTMHSFDANRTMHSFCANHTMNSLDANHTMHSFGTNHTMHSFGTNHTVHNFGTNHTTNLAKFCTLRTGSSISDVCSALSYDQSVQKYVALCCSEYAANKVAVDKFMKEYLSKARADQTILVLLEGSPLNNNADVHRTVRDGATNCYYSERSLNLIKMFTQKNIGNIYSINVMAHPAIHGYAFAATERLHGPYVFAGGKFFADHDEILQLYSADKLVDALRVSAPFCVDRKPSDTTDLYDSSPNDTFNSAITKFGNNYFTKYFKHDLPVDVN